MKLDGLLLNAKNCIYCSTELSTCVMNMDNSVLLQSLYSVYYYYEVLFFEVYHLIYFLIDEVGVHAAWWC